MALGRTISIKVKLAVILLGILVPLVAYLLFYNFFMMEAVNEKVIDSYQTTLQLYCANVEDELTVIERNMLDLVTNNVDFALLRHAASDVDAYLSAYEVMQRYNSWLTAHASIGALYVWPAPTTAYTGRCSGRRATTTPSNSRWSGMSAGWWSRPPIPPIGSPLFLTGRSSSAGSSGRGEPTPSA